MRPNFTGPDSTVWGRTVPEPCDVCRHYAWSVEFAFCILQVQVCILHFAGLSLHCAEFRVEQILSCNEWAVAGALPDHSWPAVIIIAYTHLIFNSFQQPFI